MHVQSIIEEISRLYGVTARCGGQPRQNLGHIGDNTSKERQRGAKLKQ